MYMEIRKWLQNKVTNRLQCFEDYVDSLLSIVFDEVLRTHRHLFEDDPHPHVLYLKGS